MTGMSMTNGGKKQGCPRKSKRIVGDEVTVKQVQVTKSLSVYRKNFGFYPEGFREHY